MPNPLNHLLSAAVARNAGTVLSLPAGCTLVHFKSRFLGQENGGLWVESVTGKGKWIDELIQRTATIGLSFRGQPLRVVFASTMVRRGPIPLADGGTIEGILVREPESMSEIQRRASYRVRIPQQLGLGVRVWRISDRAMLQDEPREGSEVPVRIEDLSTGGMRLLCPPKKDGPQLFFPQHRLRIALLHPDGELLLDSRVRRAREFADDSVELGVEFVRLFSNPQAQAVQAKLCAVIAELQRVERRRAIRN